MKRLVIGILAHVDSGKTTLSEALLYRTGETRKLGRVDHKDAFLDTHTIEKDRGITIFSKQAVFHTKNTIFTLLDTPGHVDFSAETERTLQVLDYAVLVISASDGVQSHTETLWNLLARYNIPVFLFVNKMDLPSDKENILNDLKRNFGGGFVDFSGDDFMEEVAVCDDFLTDKFLENDRLEKSDIAYAIQKRKVFPCYFGSALKMTGVDGFITGLENYTKASEYKKEFAARVFKIAEDEQKNRLTYMKITGGELKVKSLVNAEKVNQIRIYSGAKYQAVDTALSGSVCAVTGLAETFAGQGLGAESNLDIPITEPVLNYKIKILDNTDAHTVLSYLKQLEQEDPQLNIVWNGQLGEIHAKVMGEVQIEVLKRIISERFGTEVDFDQGSIAYKETIAETVEGVGHYEPLRHYAEVHLLIEPGERNSGISVSSACSEDELDRNWQRLILTHIYEKTHIGVLTGSPLTDVKITLVAGRAHLKHTEGGDFRQATYRAIRQGLRSTRSILLEPYYNFKLSVPTEYIGRAMTDVTRMGGDFGQPELDGDMSVISGSVPVSQMRGYHTEMISYTSGKGKLVCVLKGYEECHNSDEIIESIGYNCDADLENTADSVFCSHGAGFNVKWNEVYNYMHLDAYSYDYDEDEDEEVSYEERAERYIHAVADDNELLRIFEQTYGPIKRKAHTAMRKRTVSDNPKKFKTKPVPTGPEYLLVDGYNIIFAWEDLTDIAKTSLENARNRLIDILCNYQGFRGCEVIVVFDAYKVKNNPGEVEKIRNITVVYTKEAETADMYIEKVTHEIGKRHRVRVATSDGLEQLIILGNGAYRMSASTFRKEIEDAENAIRDYLRKR